MHVDSGTSVAVAPAARQHSLTGKATLNALASGLDYGARAVVELLVTPLVVAGVGTAAYGAWRVLWQWTTYVWGASGRSAQALQFAIANKQFTAAPDEKRQLVGAAVLVWLMFLPLLVTAGALGAWLAPELLDVPADQVGALRLAAAILALDALAVSLLGLPRSCLVGENLGYQRMGLSAVLVATGGALLVLAVRLDLGLPGVAGATVVTTCLTGAAFWWVARRRLPWFGIARPARTVTRLLVRLSLWFVGWKLVLELMVASDILVLAAFVPLSAVAAFALTKWVADTVAQLLGLVVQASIPGIGGYLGAGALAKAARLRGEVLGLVWVLGTGLGCTVVVWNGSFVRLWVGERMFVGTAATVLVVLLALQLALIRADTFVIDVALAPRTKVVAGLAAAVLSIVLGLLALGPLDGGVTGLCVGLLLGRGVLSVVAPLAVGRRLGVPTPSQLRCVGRPALVTAVLVGGSAWVAGQVAVTSWPGLVLGVLVTAPVACVASGATGLPHGVRRRLVARGRAVLAGPRGADS